MLTKSDLHTEKIKSESTSVNSKYQSADKVVLSDNDSDEQETEQNGKAVSEEAKPSWQQLHHRDDDDICELEHLRKLFIGGLASYTTEESLRDFYGQWGKVVDVVVMRDTLTKRSRGFGFITFTKSSMVDKAQDNRPHVIDGKTVEAKRALPRPERENRETNISVKKLFVGGLKDNHDEDCLEEYFSQFGKVISVKILTDKTTGKRRGFAFIEFDDYDAVDKAILKKTHQIKYVVVDVKKSVYNQEKQQRGESNSNITLAGHNAPQKPPLNYGGQHQQPQPSGYGPPPAQGPPPPYQQPPPMHAAPPAPNYNYWGPPPPAMPPQQYGGGGCQQPPAPQMNNWNYAPAPNGWNQGPPPPPAPGPAPNWHTANQWGGPPPAGPPQQVPVAAPVRPPPNGNWNTQPVQAPAVPPAGPPINGPPPPQQQQQQQVPPPAHNFGNGYQQNYGGGPTKQHSNMNANRMNPYGAPPNAYANNVQQPTAAPYGPYNGAPPSGMPPVNAGPAPVPKPMSNRLPPQGNNKFRR